MHLLRGFSAVWGQAAICLLLALPAPSQAGTGNPMQDAFQARSDEERKDALHEAVRRGGDECDAITLVFHAGMDARRNAFWDFRCAGGVDYRALLPPERFASASFLRCGSVVRDVYFAGPCFQAVVLTQGRGAARAAGDETLCRSTCTLQPASGQRTCMQRCLLGQGTPVGQQTSDIMPPNSRFGAMYTTEQPFAAYGFANGNADRLAVNLTAVRSCQTLAGLVPCKFQGELINQCGAIAMAISRHPRALAITADPSTQILNLSTTGRGATRAAAEAEALEACTPAEGPGIQCRIVAQGC
jgi:hypothetical protein